jgi:tetratricopeptide (TPR) repeat protein
MAQKILIILFLLSSFNLAGLCEIIKLKNGRTIEGKIVEKTDQYVLLEVSGVQVKYYIDEIENITDKEKIVQVGQNYDEQPLTAVPSPQKNFFNDEDWRYSFEYPLDWEILPKEQNLEGFAVSLKPKVMQGDSDLPQVTVNIQRGRISDTYLNQDLTPQKLLDLLVKFPDYTEHEQLKSVSFTHISGYLIRAFKKKSITLTNVQGLENGIELTYRTIDDYYLFSPVLSGDKSDNRFFSIVIGYTLYSDVVSRDSLRDNEIIQKFNSQFRLKNEQTQKYLKQVERLLDSFRYSLSSPAQGTSGVPSLKEIELYKPKEIKPARLTISKLQQLQEYIQRAVKFLTDKKYKEAVIELEKALNISPDHAAALYYLGRAYFSMGDTEKAVEQYRKVLKLAPNYAETYIDLGLVTASLNRHEEAIGYYQKAIELDADNIAAYNSLAFAYTSLGKYNDAIDSFKKSIKIKAQNPEAYMGLGYLYSATGQYQEAKGNFRKAREIFQTKGDTSAIKNIDDYLKSLPQ